MSFDPLAARQTPVMSRPARVRNDEARVQREAGAVDQPLGGHPVVSAGKTTSSRPHPA